MNSNNKPDQVATAADNGKRSPVAASNAPNYGTIETLNKRITPTTDLETRPNTNLSEKFTNPEPPKPAIRRKILQQQQPQQQLVKMDQNKPEQKTTSDTYRKINESSLINENKLPASLPLPEDFEIVHNQQQDIEPSRSSHCQRPYPKKVSFIVANEFCERFSYYGLRTVLVLYFRSVLGFSNSAATVSFHLFATLCYLTPILGAILGDSIWGKYKTILYLSVVYFLGELILVMSSIFWDLSGMSVAITFIGLLLIGIGTGGIKPCVSAFGGDQFHSHETQWRENFFSIFYAAINLGSLISMFLTPMLKSNYQCVGRADCYPYAFGLPCAIMLVSIIIFVAAYRYYTISPLPENSVILAFGQCVWLALRRKFLSSDETKSNKRDDGISLKGAQINRAMADSSPDNTSGSSLSLGSRTDEQLVVVSDQKSGNKTSSVVANKASEPPISKALPDDQDLGVANQDHWLYLASDRFSTSEIEDFRCVLGIFLLFLPTPVYWCLFDQQGSLWTLQATRMDGRVPGTNFTLEPDQMMVANPLLLLVFIALFQTAIYPCLNRCNLITTSIKRMTTGGLIAASAFVASAMIEIHLQQNLPREMPPPGFSRILLVNGLSECLMSDPTISYVQIPTDLASISPDTSAMSWQAILNNSTATSSLPSVQQDKLQLRSLSPLSSQQVDLKSPIVGGLNQTFPLNNYNINFRLTNNGLMPNATNKPLVVVPPLSGNTTEMQLITTACPIDSSQDIELSLGVLPELSTKLLYIEQGNGKLNYKLFDDSMSLPLPGNARVRLLFGYFGSATQAHMRRFNLTKFNPDKNVSIGDQEDNKQDSEFVFNKHDGQVLISDYVDIKIASTRGDLFKLKLASEFANTSTAPQFIRNINRNLDQSSDDTLFLKPGTRNLLIVQQKDAKTFVLSHEILQDNEYRVSMLLQLIPYSLISISEVMFSITGLEFSYAMAPHSMKSLMLGAWSLTTAFGNILTVAVESVHPFENLANDFLFYSALMVIDIFVFALIGYYYKPYRPKTIASEIQ